MATLYRNPRLDPRPENAGGHHHHGKGPGYSGPVEIDTRIPPKARPVFTAVSVNGVAIPEAEILAEAQHHPADNPGAALLAAARALVVRALLLQEARRLGVGGSADAESAERREADDAAAIRVLIEQEVRAPTATEAECRRYHAAHPERFRSAAIYEARHILLAAAPGDTATRAAARAEAERLVAHLHGAPADFAASAAQHSACPSAQQGGNLGQLTPGSTVAEFERALEAMQAGDISAAPVESRFGFHIIALDRKIPGEPLPFEAVEQRIAGWLEAASWSKTVAQYIAVLAGRAEITGIDLASTRGPLVQ
jgi:peptidyl-prolyl cis-trans isomerase C